MDFTQRTLGMFFGLAAGDALGVPVEFCRRNERKADPVREMRAFGSHGQEAGTWSDDASLSFCTAETMLDGYSAEGLGRKFLRWYHENHWTARGQVFDIGISTRQALRRLASGTAAQLAGGADESENGNGSLMRMAPLAWHPEQEEAAFFALVAEASSITHRHPRSILACHYYLCFLRQLLKGKSPSAAHRILQQEWPEMAVSLWAETKTELPHFSRLLSENFASLPEPAIESGGYVMQSLEAAIWCLLNTTNYRDAVELAVNLGGDTDSTAAICGALAGTHYGKSGIPEEWLAVLAGFREIENLAHRFAKQFRIHASAS